jgi:hypothetical protein
MFHDVSSFPISFARLVYQKMTGGERGKTMKNNRKNWMYFINTKKQWGFFRWREK